MVETAPLRALIYTRISSDPTGLRAGVERQAKDCRALAKKLGWTVIDVIEDNDMSAWSGRKLRPGFKTLLDALESGAADAVVAWHVDRLTRSTKELQAILDVLERRPQVRVATVQAGELDLGTPSGKATAKVVVTMAEYESDIKSARIKAQKASAKANGTYLGSVRPFGGRIVDGRLEPDPVEAPVVKEAAELLLSTWPMAAVVRKMNDDGWTTTYKRGGKPANLPWHTQGLRALMLRENLHVIIGQDLADSVQALLKQPGRKRGGPGAGRKRRYTGVLFCSCGAPVRGAGGPPTPRYRCKRQTSPDGADLHVSGRRADEVDRIIDRYLVGRLTRRDTVELLSPDADSKRAEYSAELVALDERAKEAQSMFADGLMSAADLRGVLARINESRAEVAGKLASVSGAGSRELRTLLATDDVETAFHAMSDDEVRALAKGLIESVTLRSRRGAALAPEDVTVTWRRA
jgi:site-specific DNA recombinase